MTCAERRDVQEEELDRQVNEAAAKMIAAANKERAAQPDGRSMLHEVRTCLLWELLRSRAAMQAVSYTHLTLPTKA